ncbi:MAG TPA: OmpA family protein [Gammaproteobacteria bacterium]|jgi:outer membrane protein OmpA-like peptidoglycan-associated protein|nr:OmpA family protein [Gammaproteobacteria bacterium]
MHVRSVRLLAAAALVAACSGAFVSPRAEAAPACPAPPTAFGTKDKLAVGVEGKIYFVEKTTRALPDFAKLESQGSIYTAKWDVPQRSFREGFPGVTNRFEWFALDYRGSIYVAHAGAYAFRLGSDDGSILYIDGKPVVNIDGLHPWWWGKGTANLTEGDHAFRLSYMQGPAYSLGVQLFVTPPSAKEQIFNLQDFSRAVLDSRASLAVTEDANEIRVSLGAQVLFDTGKYALREEATQSLRKVGVLVRSYPGLPILVEGHTDGVGSESANQLLSERRAHAVTDWLVANSKVPAGCFTTKGYGETAPVASNDTDEGRQQNRRVEIKLQKTPQPAAKK